MANDQSPVKRDILMRVRLLYVVFILMALAIVGKIAYTQIIYGPSLKATIKKITYPRVRIPASRGDVLARDGGVLATTIPMFDVRVDFAAEIVDTTMKNMARAEIRVQAKTEREKNKNNRQALKEISIRTSARLRDHAALSVRARQIYELQLDTLANGLSVIFGDRTPAQYKKMLADATANRWRNRSPRINPRRMTFEELRAMMSLPILNIKRLDDKGKTLLIHLPKRGCSTIEQINIREHPFGSLALRTIGMSREDSTTKIIDGIAHVVPVSIKRGVEGAFDQYLRGKDGNTIMQSVSGITSVPVQDPGNREPVHGIDVVTTIDVDLQDIAERELRKQLEKEKAEWGTVVLMEVSTGEIHAMSNLTRHSDGRIVDDLNYAITHNMEPGSTFKLATMITLLDDAGMSLEDMIDTGGKQATVGRAIVTDDHAQLEPISMLKAMEVSSNIAFSKWTHEKYADDPKRFVDHLRKIGLDKPLNIQISGSVAPVFYNPGSAMWTKGYTLEQMAYGYASLITPMRTLALYNAVANDGKMISPVIVKELRQYGQTVRKLQTQTIVESICTPKTLDLVRTALQSVVEHGTAKILSNKNYTVAAKTGTAQVAFGNRGYKDAHQARRYIATIIGYFPADKPKYTCIVVMQTYYGNGNYGQFYGASLAGPVLNAVAKRIFASQIHWHQSVSDQKSPLNTPVPLKSGRVEDIKEVAKTLSLPITIENGLKNKDWASVQTDSLQTSLAPPAVSPLGTVPSVMGMGLKEAIFVLEQSGLKVAFSGKGKVVSQSLTPKTLIHKGQVIIIQLN